MLCMRNARASLFESSLTSSFVFSESFKYWCAQIIVFHLTQNYLNGGRGGGGRFESSRLSHNSSLASIDEIFWYKSRRCGEYLLKMGFLFIVADHISCHAFSGFPASKRLSRSFGGFPMVTCLKCYKLIKLLENELLENSYPLFHFHHLNFFLI